MSKESWKLKTGAMRESNGVKKGRMDLVPASSLIRVSKRFQDNSYPYGKYPPNNWKKGMNVSICIDSAIRHLYEYLDGQSNEDHLAAACCNVLMAMWTEDHKPECQDIEERKRTS